MIRAIIKYYKRRRSIAQIRQAIIVFKALPKAFARLGYSRQVQRRFYMTLHKNPDEMVGVLKDILAQITGPSDGEAARRSGGPQVVSQSKV